MKSKVSALMGIIGAAVVVSSMFMPLLAVAIEVGAAGAESTKGTAYYTLWSPQALELDLPLGGTYEVKLGQYLTTMESILLYLLPMALMVAVVGVIAIAIASKGKTLLFAGGSIFLISAISAVSPVILLYVAMNRVADDLKADIAALAPGATVEVEAQIGLGSYLAIAASVLLVISAILAFIARPPQPTRYPERPPRRRLEGPPAPIPPSYPPATQPPRYTTPQVQPAYPQPRPPTYPAPTAPPSVTPRRPPAEYRAPERPPPPKPVTPVAPPRAPPTVPPTPPAERRPREVSPPPKPAKPAELPREKPPEPPKVPVTPPERRPPAPPMVAGRCPYCGKEIPGGVTQCPFCGSELTNLRRPWERRPPS